VNRLTSLAVFLSIVTACTADCPPSNGGLITSPEAQAWATLHCTRYEVECHFPRSESQTRLYLLSCETTASYLVQGLTPTAEYDTCIEAIIEAPCQDLHALPECFPFE
jgi:hypothetical protein